MLRHNNWGNVLGQGSVFRFRDGIVLGLRGGESFGAGECFEAPTWAHVLVTGVRYNSLL